MHLLQHQTRMKVNSFHFNHWHDFLSGLVVDSFEHIFNRQCACHKSVAIFSMLIHTTSNSSQITHLGVFKHTNIFPLHRIDRSTTTILVEIKGEKMLPFWDDVTANVNDRKQKFKQQLCSNIYQLCKLLRKLMMFDASTDV